LKKPITFLILGIGFLVLDQYVKYWVRQSIPVGGSIHGLPIPRIFEITLQYNKGIAFGFLQGKGKLLSPIAVAIAAGSAWYSFKNPKESWLTHIAMGLLAAGALGNLLDRIVAEKVTDMFWFRLINFPVFNVADSCITVATVLLILTWFKAAEKGKKAAEPIAETPQVETE
jgi:signal peptidase II